MKSFSYLWDGDMCFHPLLPGGMTEEGKKNQARNIHQDNCTLWPGIWVFNCSGRVRLTGSP